MEVEDFKYGVLLECQKFYILNENRFILIGHRRIVIYDSMVDHFADGIDSWGTTLCSNLSSPYEVIRFKISN